MSATITFKTPKPNQQKSERGEDTVSQHVKTRLEAPMNNPSTRRHIFFLCHLELLSFLSMK
jgi:hypothetical protein